MLVKSLSIESLLLVLPLPTHLPRGDEWWGKWTLFQEFRGKDGFPVLLPMSPSDSGRVPSASSKRDAHFLAATRRSILQGDVGWKSTKETKCYSKDTIIDKVTGPSKSTIFLIAVIIKVSPRHTADLINTDSRHSCVTEMLQNTWQGSEKFAKTPVPTGRSSSRLQYVVATFSG